MSGFLIGTSLVIGLTGIVMFVAPQIVANRLSLALLPTDSTSRRTYRIGGGVLIALALVLITQLLSE